MRIGERRTHAWWIGPAALLAATLAAACLAAPPAGAKAREHSGLALRSFPKAPAAAATGKPAPQAQASHGAGKAQATPTPAGRPAASAR